MASLFLSAARFVERLRLSLYAATAVKGRENNMAQMQNAQTIALRCIKNRYDCWVGKISHGLIRRRSIGNFDMEF